MKILFVIFQILWFINFHSFGQSTTSFYLQPHFGWELPFATFENKNTLPSFIKGAPVDVTVRLGLSLLVDFNRKFSMEFGYDIGSISTVSIKYGSGGLRQSSTEMRRFTFKIHKPIANIKIARSGKKTREYTNKKFFWAIFDLNLMAGITSDNIVPTNWNSSLGINTGSFTGSRDIINLSDTVKVLKDSGYGFQLGLNLQFYNNGKRRLQLGFMYHQGINRRLKSTWSTSINGTPFPEFDMYSRGSMFAMYAAYPLLLFETNKKK